MKKYPQNTFDFNEAIGRVVNGKKVTNQKWPKGYSVFLNNNEDGVLTLRDNKGNINTWIISMSDLQSKDYVEC